MIELYETKYQICNHFTTQNPLASVQFNEAEEYLRDYLYDGYLETFIYKEIGKKMNISFDEYLDKPRYEIEMIHRVIESIDQKKAKMNAELMKNLEKETPKPNMNLED